MVTRRPALRPAIAVCIGIALAAASPVVWQIGFGAATVFGIGACLWKTQRNLLVIAFWTIYGASLLSFRMAERDPRDLRNLFGAEAELVTARGILSADPEQRVLEQDRRTRYRTTARMKVREIQRQDRWYPAAGEIAISTTGFIPDEFVAGTEAQISGVLAAPEGPIAPGLFDFQRYLKWQRIFFTLRAEGAEDWQLIRQPSGWSGAALYRKFNEWARRTLQRGIPYDENTRLLWAMTLGWRPGLTNEVSEPFMRTGTLHQLTIEETA